MRILKNASPYSAQPGGADSRASLPRTPERHTASLLKHSRAVVSAAVVCGCWTEARACPCLCQLPQSVRPLRLLLTTVNTPGETNRWQTRKTAAFLSHANFS